MKPIKKKEAGYNIYSYFLITLSEHVEVKKGGG